MGMQQCLGCARFLTREWRLQAQRWGVCVHVLAVLVLHIFTGQLQELFTLFSTVRFSRGQEREKWIRQNFCSPCLNLNTFCLCFVGNSLVGKMIKEQKSHLWCWTWTCPLDWKHSIRISAAPHTSLTKANSDYLMPFIFIKWNGSKAIYVFDNPFWSFLMEPGLHFIFDCALNWKSVFSSGWVETTS